MPVDSQWSSNIGGERTPAGSASPSNGLENLLQRLTEQLAENERRHAESLRDMHTQLRRLEAREDDVVGAPAPERSAGDASRRTPPRGAHDAPFDPVSEPQLREPHAMDYPSSSRGRLGAQTRLPTPSVHQEADQPWDVDSADALSRLYEGPEAETGRYMAPQSAPYEPVGDPSQEPFDHRSYQERPSDGPSADPSYGHFAQERQPQAVTHVDQHEDAGAVHARLADVALRIEAALLELRPQNQDLELVERFDRFEKRLTSVIDNVTSRPHDSDALLRMEAQFGQLASQVDQTRADLARLDRIEEQLTELREKLSDDEVVRLFGTLVPTEEDLVRFADEAANRTAARLSSEDGHATRAGNAAEAQAAAPSDGKLETMHELLSSFIDETRRSDNATTEALEVVLTALQQVLDRVEALEGAKPVQLDAQLASPQGPSIPSGAHQMMPAGAAAMSPQAHSFASNGPQSTPVIGPAPADFVPPRGSELDYSFADQKGPMLQPIADGHDPRLQMPQGDRPFDPSHADLAAYSQQAAEMPRGPMDRKQMIEMARRAAETARASASHQPAPAGRQSKDRLGIVAAGKQSKSAVRPGLLIAASVSAFLLAGSFFILGPKLRSTNAPPAARPAPAAVESSNTSAPRGAAPEIIEEQQPSQAPAAPERRSMVPALPEREAGHAVRETAARNIASSDGIEVARFGIAIQQNPNQPSADDIIRARRRAQIANLSERTGQVAAQTAAAVVEPASLDAGAAEAQPVAVTRRAPVASETRSELVMPPIQIGPSSLRTAAAEGDASAQFEVAARFAEGKGVEKNFEQAAVWYQRAAAQGLSQAQYRLATLYERGMGVKADLERARVWYKRAADQGNVKAMHNLAVLSTHRDLGRPDYATAARYFERAAEHGLADSQFNLGVLYETGQGVSVDRITAYMWYGRAALAGDRDAERRRDQLRLKLDSASITKGEKLISEWRPHPSDSIANEARTAGDAWKRREAKASE